MVPMPKVCGIKKKYLDASLIVFIYNVYDD